MTGNAGNLQESFSMSPPKETEHISRLGDCFFSNLYRTMGTSFNWSLSFLKKIRLSESFFKPLGIFSRHSNGVASNPPSTAKELNDLRHIEQLIQTSSPSLPRGTYGGNPCSIPNSESAPNVLQSVLRCCKLGNNSIIGWLRFWMALWSEDLTVPHRITRFLNLGKMVPGNEGKFSSHFNSNSSKVPEEARIRFLLNSLQLLDDNIHELI